ncbi:ABC transporter permease subunit [Sporosarcina highlanderae]|uniref:ABC transporter permease subunit n=1 Tax=Sporosarcina highlanderae TaxID=3035916 RepID=A0ABT8JRM9_9BACL|nr:ABC transporter permease subunit [Sporosarcina highlanderae]MDN4607677.1 ABC transporter permease subunit [Sporosarcina highlanderae]
MLLRFEILKSYRQRKLLVIFILLLLAVGSLFYRNTMVQDEISKKATDEVLTHIDTGMVLRKDYERKIEEVGMTPRVQEGYDNMKAMNTAIREWEDAIHYKKWDAIPSIKKRFYETILQQNGYGYPYGDLQGVELEKEVALTNRLVELQLPYGEEIFPLSTSNFMYSANSSFLALFGILLLLVLFGDSVTSEYQQNTIRTLNTQPLTQLRILSSKIELLITVSIIVWFGMAKISFVTAFLFGMKGSFHYPILTLTEESFTIIPIYQAIIQHGILFFVVSLFMYCLLLFVSVLMRKLFSTLVVLLLVMITGLVTAAQFSILQSKWNPFFYFQIEEIIERPYMIGGFTSLWILVAYSFLLFMLSWYFTRKNVSFAKEKPVIKPYARGEIYGTDRRANLIFEWRKLKRQNTIIPLLFMLTLFAGGGFLYFNHTKVLNEKFEVSRLNDYEISSFFALIEEDIKNSEQLVSFLVNKKDSLSDEEMLQMEIAKATIRDQRPHLEAHKVELKEKRKTKQAWDEENWTNFYNEYIKNIKWKSGDTSLYPGIFIDNAPTERGGYANLSYKATISEMELLSERNLRPIFPLVFANLTMYDRFPNPIDRLEFIKREKKVDSSGLYYLYLFFSDNLYAILMLLLVFLFSAGFAAERGKKNTFSFLLTQPVKKGTIYFSKFAIPAGVTSAITIFAVLLIVLIGTIGNRLGDWNYPILFYDSEVVTAQEGYAGIMAQEGGFHFIDLGTYVTEATYILIGALLFSMALVIFISLFFNHQAIAMMTGGIFVILGVSLKGFDSFSSFAHLSPFTYLEVPKVTNGELATILNNPLISTTTGIVVLLTWTFLLYVVGLIIFKRKAWI